MASKSLKIMVLAGGPDREREVSLMSGSTVTNALALAGHDVRQRDISPSDLSALDEFAKWGAQLMFPMLHGSWGEGGGLQRILDERGIAYVGCRADAASLCMDKHKAKLVLVEKNLPTPPFELIKRGQRRTLAPPLVVKALREGSSIDLSICRNAEEVRRARSRLHSRHEELLLEKFIAGKEITVGVLDPCGQAITLPPIHIIPATEYYDFQAKYTRDDTQYRFDIAMPKAALDRIKEVSQATAAALGCRHMCRVDVIADDENNPWVLEVNTIPGFTSHSLLPKAAAQAGIPIHELVDRLARMALRDGA